MGKLRIRDFLKRIGLCIDDIYSVCGSDKEIFNYLFFNCFYNKECYLIIKGKFYVKGN